MPHRPAKIRILLVDDHILMRMGLVTATNGEPDMKVVGEVENGDEAIEACRRYAPDVIVLDPPRAGCETSVLETAAAMGPRRIVYVSCNPATLARDLAILAELGYVTQAVQPVDMFPQTYHVECIALIEKQ